MTSAVQDGTYEISDSPTIGTALAVRPTMATSVEEARAAMALRDDEQIMAACNGAVIAQWIYSFQIGGKTVEGISVTGAAEIARIRAEAGFPIQFPVIQADELMQNGRPGIRVTVIARDYRSKAESPAMVFEPYFDDKDRPNAFPERKALSKARRNAILDLVPETQVLALLRAAKESAQGKVARRPQASLRPSTPPTPGVARAADGAYGMSEPAAPAGQHSGLATTEQMAQIGVLIGRPECKAVRAKIEGRLKEAPDKAVAANAIEFLRQTVKAGGGNPDELGLDDKRASTSAVEAGH